MFGGRDGHHYPEALTARAAAAALSAAFAVAGSAFPARADVERIAPDGTVHRIIVESLSPGNPAGTALRHTFQSPGGGAISSWVTGTEDDAVDREPALEMDPSTGTPVLAWTRDEGAGPYVVLSRYEEGAWLPFLRVSHEPGDADQPRLRVGRSLIHLVHRRGHGGQPLFYRTSFERAPLRVVHGPELLPLEGASPVVRLTEPSAGSEAPPTNDLFFTAEMAGLLPEDPAILVVWGVRDEPVPIGYVQVFLLPDGVHGVEEPWAGWIGCRFALWFVASDRFYYTTRVGNLWEESRVVELSPVTSSAEARLHLSIMIGQTDNCSLP